MLSASEINFSVEDIRWAEETGTELRLNWRADKVSYAHSPPQHTNSSKREKDKTNFLHRDKNEFPSSNRL